MYRHYKDHGSLARDRKEGNLNSLNFPEFQGLPQEQAKEMLIQVAELERKGLETSLGALKGCVEEDMYRGLRTFCEVTDLYGQM